MEFINLVSDTVTVPCKEMREFIASAPVGDDVFGEDPTINELQDYTARLFNKEAALFCPSGTMTNQLAIKCHTQALDDIICDYTSHVYQYETSGYAYHSRVGVSLLQGQHGKITADQIEKAVRPDFDWLPNSRLVVLENSCNKAGGSYYTLDEIKPIYNLTREKNLSLHLDGARLFNVLVETKESTHDVGDLFDSISICLSKGLGAPVGSLLIGNADFIKKARKFRKVMGGGMRQAGIIAAGGLYALKNNVERLKEDNDRAKVIGALLSKQSYVKSVAPVHTNIIVFDLEGMSSEQFINKLNNQNILAKPISGETMRFVLHKDVSKKMVSKLMDVLANITN
jgi:threonine aldolase